MYSSTQECFQYQGLRPTDYDDDDDDDDDDWH